MKQEIENDEVRLKYGKISKFSVEQKKMQLSEMERQYTELTKEYELAKIHFENLYVSGSNLQNQKEEKCRKVQQNSRTFCFWILLKITFQGFSF